MAKKEGIDESIYVKMLVDAGMDSAEAKDSIAALVSMVNEVMPGETTESKQNLMSIKVREKIKGSKATKYKVLVAAVGPRLDQNDIKRNVAMSIYKNDANTALTEGLVKIINGKPVAVDNRKFLDAAGTIPNKGVGKPYPVRMSRELILVHEGKVVKAAGDVALVAGGVYDVYGGESKSGFMYVNAEPAPRLNKMDSEADFWDAVFAAAKTSDHALDVNGALEAEIKGLGTVLVKGFVHSVSTTSSGGTRISLNNETGSGLTVFSADESIAAVMQGLAIGNEAIIVGRLRDPKDAQYGRQLTAIGAIANPSSGAAVSNALAELKKREW